MNGPVARTLILVALTSAACARSVPPRATLVDLQRGQQRWPDLSLDALAEGRSLFMSKCSGCHQPPPPSEHAAAEWPEEVGAMAERAGLTDDVREKIERYLITMADSARP